MAITTQHGSSSTLGAALIEQLDFVMLMCTTPGESGGKFQKENFQKINQLKYEYPNLSITIDGGVNSEVAFILRLLGVDTIVSGSYLMDKSEYGANMLNLLRPYAGETFTCKRFYGE
jgi:ribulose-phosphate 3-epimerase